MDNSGSRNRNGNPVIGYRRHNKGNQLWVPQFVGGNRFILRNPQTNRCLDNTGRARAGRHYHIWACNARNKNQWFTIMAPNRRPVRPTRPVRRMPNNYLHLRGPRGLCVGATRKNGARLFQGHCRYNSQFLWRFYPVRNQYLLINRGGLVMDNSGSRNRNGNPVIGYRRHNKGNQLWVPQFVGGNRFILRNPQTNSSNDNNSNNNNDNNNNNNNNKNNNDSPNNNVKNNN